MKKKYAWLVAVVILILVPLLAACGGATPTPTPTPTPTLTPTPTPTGGPTAMPHTLERGADCLMCHASGDLAVPADHAGRSSETCTTCHKPAP